MSWSKKEVIRLVAIFAVGIFALGLAGFTHHLTFGSSPTTTLYQVPTIGITATHRTTTTIHKKTSPCVGGFNPYTNDYYNSCDTGIVMDPPDPY